MVLIEQAIALALLVLVVVFNGLHQVPEGHVAVYYRGGALLDTTGNPGWNVKIPVVTTFENIQVTVQTDKVQDIPCGTAGGVMIKFDEIEVVNRLNRNLVHETIKNYTVNYD